MIDIKLTLNGKPFRPDDFQDAIEKAIYQKVVDHITSTVGDARCPEHGQQPSITVSGTSLEDLSINVSGCCQKLIDTVKDKLK
jgi:hypothetical protein